MELKPKKILIIQTASIGDVILITPMIEAINKNFPDSDIDLLLKKGNESLFEAHPFISKVYAWDKAAKKYRNLYKILRAIRLEKYDAVFNCQRFFSTGLLTVLSNSRHTAGFNKNPLSFFFSRSQKHIIGTGLMHETERNMTLLTEWCDWHDPRPVLYPSTSDFARVSQFKTVAYICIAPSSLWFTKQFPEKQWAEFITNIPPDLNVFLIGSSADKETCERIRKQANHPCCMVLAGKLKLLETAALMRDAGMNYVNDSAPLHLASALNAPTCAVFCSTVNAFGFGPLSENSYIIETEEKLRCRPCGLHGHKECPEKHFKCATEIKTEQLLKHLPYGF